MAGRKRKPAQQQINEGDPSKRGVHQLDKRLDSEPKAPSGLPECPKHLKGRSRSAWNFWSEQLAIMKLDKRPDGPMLEGACVAYARAVAADLILETEGLTFKDSYIDAESKEVIVLKIRKHPAVEISNRAWLLVKAFCVEFGLSPASRTRLVVDKGDKDDDAAVIAALSQPRERTLTTVN